MKPVKGGRLRKVKNENFLNVIPCLFQEREGDVPAFSFQISPFTLL